MAQATSAQAGSQPQPWSRGRAERRCLAMFHLGQLLLGGAVGGALGGLMVKLHALSHLGVSFHLRAIAAGSRTFEEYDHRGSILAALVDARAWNRLVLDVHGKVLECWPR
uniref:Uncharacterized protein n=1 Tax=Alexandrium catenella TaxID=2925 RepID=A0A7S1S5P7_ALECA